MELTNGEIVLRPATVKDAPAAHAAIVGSLSELAAWMPWAHAGYSLEESVAWAKHCEERWQHAERQRAFYIWDVGGGFLGSIDLRIDDDDAEAEIGYWVATPVAGRGICTAAVGLIATWGFEDFTLDRIRIRVDPANTASRRVATKAGGREEPGLHRHVHEDGSVHELVTFVLVRPR